MKKLFLFSALLLFCFSSFITAQGNGSQTADDARSVGMAKTFTSSTFGLFAIGKNPANLFVESGKQVEFTLPLPLPTFSANAGTNFMSIDDYNYYFGTEVKNNDGTTTGRILTQEDKNKLKDLFKDGGTVTSDVSVTLFSISVKPGRDFGTIAFTISDRVSSAITFPKKLIDLGFDGNLPDAVYNFSDTRFNAWWLRKYSLSYSRNINLLPQLFKDFSIGISLNAVSGFAYAGLDHINTELTTGTNNVITGRGDFLVYSALSPDFKIHYNFENAPEENFSFKPFPSPVGKGFGFDFGINAKLSNTFSFGLSVTDIGSIKWDKNVAQYSSNAPIYLDDLTDEAQRDTLVNRITGKENGKFISSITTQMASALHLGFSYIASQKLLIAADYHQGFNDQPGNSKKPRFSIGMDLHDIGAFAFRSGFSFGGYDKFNWGFGLGMNFGILELNFGSSDFQYAFSPKATKRLTFAVDSKWKF